MFGADSRYANQPLLDAVREDGVPVRYAAPRILPPAGQGAIGVRHRTTDSDRLDLLAYRHLGNPTAWWMIADANLATHPDALPGAPGDLVAIPMPGTGRAGG